MSHVRHMRCHVYWEFTFTPMAHHKIPPIVAEYTQYVDTKPREPIRLAVALKDLDGCEITENKLTAVVRYWTPYFDSDGKRTRMVISFGLGESIVVNSIVGLPFLAHCKA